MSSAKARAFFSAPRSWQWIKHTIFEGYLWPWAMKVGSTSPRIWVVDALAGAGTYADAESGARSAGSPLIAARVAAAYASARPARAMRVICVERDAVNHAALVEGLAPFDGLVTVHRGTFGTHIEAILEQTRGEPMLLFLDPFGLQALDHRICGSLLGRAGKTDVFVSVIFAGAHRTAGKLDATGRARAEIHGSEAEARTVDGFFGCEDWRMTAVDTSKSKEEREREWLGLFFRRVVPPSYLYRCAYPVRARHQGSARYWLVQLSKHRDAFWLMNDQVVMVDRALYRKGHEDAAALPGISAALDADHAHRQDEALRKAVLTLLDENGGELAFGEFQERLVQRFFGRVKEGDYSRAVKGLVGEAIVTREQRAAAKLRADERIRLANLSTAGVPRATRT
jgi:three-Cys-motif partner protein